MEEFLYTQGDSTRKLDVETGASFDKDDVTISSSDSGGVDFSIDPDINIEISDGAVTAAGVGLGSAIVPAAAPTLTGFAAVVPVVGQVLAGVAILYSIGSMIDQAAKAKKLQLALKNLKVQNDLLKSEVSIQMWGANQRIQAYNTAIAIAIEKTQQVKTVQTVSITLVSLATLALGYSLLKRK